MSNSCKMIKLTCTHLPWSPGLSQWLQWWVKWEQESWTWCWWWQRRQRSDSRLQGNPRVYTFLSASSGFSSQMFFFEEEVLNIWVKIWVRAKKTFDGSGKICNRWSFPLINQNTRQSNQYHRLSMTGTNDALSLSLISKFGSSNKQTIFFQKYYDLWSRHLLFQFAWQ